MATEKLRIELQAITARAEKDIRRFQGSVNKAAKAVQTLGSSGKRSMRPLGEGLSAASVNASEFEKSMAAANARVIAFGASAGLIYQVQRALKETVKATIEVEKSFANINIVLNASQATLQKFGNTLFTISGQTGQSFRDVSEAATELARQGLSMEKTLSRTKDALILTRLTGMGAVESVESLTAAVNSFSNAGVTSAQVINKMAKVDQAFAVSSEDLAKSIARVGSSAVDAGVSLDQLLAITTAVQQRTARGGAVIGNAFKTIFTRIGRTDVQEKLNAIGVATKDMQGNMLGATQVLQNLSQRFQELTKNQQNNIAESVAGVFQVNILRAALGDLSNKYGVYNKALKDSTSATDEAYKKNEELNKTLDSLVNKTLANLTKAGSGIGELTLKPALEKVLGSVNEVIEGFGEGGRFEKFGQGMGKEILEGLGRFISGPGLAMGAIAIGKLLYNFSKFAKQAVGGIMELNANVANRKNLEALVTQELLKQPDIIARIERNQTTVEKEAADILSLYKRQNTEAEKLKMTTAAIAGEMAAINRSRVAGGGGRAGGSRFGRRRASGFIPNFASEDQERIEASLGGYQAGAIKKMTIPGEGPILYNSAETVKRFPGMTQPAIMPPEGSRAGAAYKTSFSDVHGFDPYKGQGFVPNFRVIPPEIYRKNPHAEYDGKLNTRKITADIKSDKLSAEEAREWGYAGTAVAVKKKNNSKKKKNDGEEEPDILNGTFGEEVGQKYGVLSLMKQGSNTYSASLKEFPALGLTGEKYKDLHDRKITIKGVHNKNFYDVSGKEASNNEFSKMIRNHFSKPLTYLAKDFSEKHLGLGNDSPKIADITPSGNTLFPPGAEGSIFEATIKAMTKDSNLFEKSLADPHNSIWDFEESGSADSKLIKNFGFPSGLKKADAKRTLDHKQRLSILNKIINTNKNGKEGFSTQIKEYLKIIEKEKSDIDKQKTKTKKRALGFVPSFSSAISEAIEREKSAGIPSSSIRIGSDSRLSSKANPMGLGVYNTKDEPAGLGQGIDRSIRMGQDPKTHGAAKGFVPNFMWGVAGTGAKALVGVTQKAGLLTKALDSLTKTAGKAAGSIKKYGKAGYEKVKDSSGMGAMGLSMAGSYLATSSVTTGDSPLAGVASAAASGLEVGGSLAMIHPLIGVVAGLGVAAVKGYDPLLELVGLKHKETNQTEYLNSHLVKLVEHQTKATEGFSELSDKINQAAKAGRNFTAEETGDVQKNLTDTLNGFRASLTGVGLDLDEEGQELEKRIKNVHTPEQAAALMPVISEYGEKKVNKTLEDKETSEKISSLQSKINIQPIQPKSGRSVTAKKDKARRLGAHYYSGGSMNPTAASSMTKTFEGFQGGGLSEIFKSKIAKRYSSVGSDLASDELSFEGKGPLLPVNSEIEGPMPVADFGKAAQDKALEDFSKVENAKPDQKINELAKFLTGAEDNEEVRTLINDLNSLIEKTTVDVIGKNATPESFQKQKTEIVDTLVAKQKESLSEGGVVAGDIKESAKKQGDLTYAGARVSQEQRLAQIAAQKDRDRRAEGRGTDLYQAQINLNAGKRTRSNNLLIRRGEESQNLAAAGLEKQLAVSNAQSSMNPFGVAQASFDAQKNYINKFEQEKSQTMRQDFSGKISDEADTFKSSAQKVLAGTGMDPASDAYKSQKAALEKFSSVLSAASEQVKTNGEIDSETIDQLKEKRKELLINIEKEKESKDAGAQDRIAVQQEMLKSLDSLEGISTGFESQKLTLNNQVTDMNTANENMKKVREQQLRNAEKFNSEERDYQLRLKAIRANHLALEADNMASKGRITATEAARRKAAKLEADRDDKGMGDIVSESKASASIGIQESLGYNQRNFVNDIQSSFKEIGDTFKSGMADAIKGMVTGATDFKSAMASVFGSIADKTADKGIEMGVNAMMNVGMQMFQKSSGGPIRKYQTGGLVTGGSGVKDDVLTMMQGGEYVIRKSAVNQIPGGVSTLDAINRSAGGQIPRFAKGGQANISLKRDFKYTGKDKTRPDGGHFDVDSRLSTLGFFGAQGTKTNMFEKQKTLNSYLDYKKQEQERRDAIIAKDLAERKGRLTKAWTSAAMAVGAQALSSMNFGGAPEGTKTVTNVFGESSSVAPGTFTPTKQMGGFMDVTRGFASGGRVPSYALGGSTSGRIPGMVMGGEYIMSPQATQQYGSGFMAQLNRGQLPGFAEGGLVGAEGEKAATDNEESKAKESSTTTNNVTISINIDKTGKSDATEEESSSEGGSDEDITKSKEFSQAIKSVVLEEIVKQQRPGGLLRDNDSKG